MMKLTKPPRADWSKLMELEEFIDKADRANGKRKVTKINFKLEINASKWLTTMFIQTIRLSLPIFINKATDQYYVEIDSETDHK